MLWGPILGLIGPLILIMPSDFKLAAPPPVKESPTACRHTKIQRRWQICLTENIFICSYKLLKIIQLLSSYLILFFQRQLQIPHALLVDGALPCIRGRDRLQDSRYVSRGKCYAYLKKIREKILLKMLYFVVKR